MRKWHRSVALFVAVSVVLLSVEPISAQWKRHTIDDSSRGADGVRLGDVNRDGLVDLVCGWEEGGVIRVYLQPVPVSLRTKPWPQVTVGKVRSPEDAVFVDLDNDGRLDVVSSTEGRNRTLYVHWANWDADSVAEMLDASRWETAAIPCSAEKQSWMFALPMELDGMPGPELIVGSKGGNASVSLLRGGADRRNLQGYQLQPLYKAGWIMSLKAADIDGDGDDDVLCTDRKGANRGVLWLENPGVKAVVGGKAWRLHRVAGSDSEVMFLDYGNLLGNEAPEIVTATRNQKILVSKRPVDVAKLGHNESVRWPTTTISNPFDAPHGKAVAIADVNQDGRPDLIHTVNNGGRREHRGASWLEAGADGQWKTHDVSGERGVKFDLIQVHDVDGDGDLDWLTCEERDNLGIFWYENPTR